MEGKNLELILDVKVRLTVQLGSCQLPMREIMELAPGSVLQLSQSATEPVGLFVNERLIGHGEVVIVEDRFGIKVTKLAETEE